MTWLFVALSAYTILAVVNIADKFILKNVFPNAKAYTFLVGLLGMVLFVLAPWFLSWPGFWLFLGNLIAGACFTAALLLLYSSLKKGDVSQVIVLIGGAVPIFTLILSLIFLGERFTGKEWWAFLLLLVGTVMISWLPKSHGLWARVQSWFKLKSENYWHGIGLAAAAGFMFATSFVFSKYLYNQQEFFSAFIWMRAGTFLAAFGLILNKQTRKALKKSFKKLNLLKKSVFLGTQALAGLGFILQNYAITIGSVVLVTALQGYQYSALLVLSSIITIFYPNIFKEKVSKFIIFQKIAAIALISLGLYFIASA